MIVKKNRDKGARDEHARGIEEHVIHSDPVIQRSPRATAEVLRRRREAVANLTRLVERDGRDSIWAELLEDAQARLDQVINDARGAAPSTIEIVRPSRASHVIVGDHTPEPRTW